ncbi:hypothetical protein C5167_001095 [Papaver somniferum]|uniref:Uncharacterized protein n=1 Tax=Papaver somniferum TaxID=3469 RepID=A0A4Y7KYH2_PAPSO|nr:trichohyalin-like [Papaver somniferum]RZC76975.1 hypothetical protein C5167_001095 [Papaver somniferum]
MGCSLNKQARRKKPCRQTFVRALTEKIILLEEDMSEIRRKRGKESEVHEQQVRAFEAKQTGWVYERKRLREEIKQLKKESEEKDRRIQRLIQNNSINYDQHNITIDEENYKGKDWQHVGASYNYLMMMENMREEQLRREEAIEKWKRLYLAIKTELDDLIERTCRGGRGYWRVEDETTEELQREVKAKEETIAVLKARLAAREEEGRKMKTEVDILRQSSRIMSHAKRTKYVMRPISRRLHF